MHSISIVVPIYKVESYLQRCIDSVLAQNFTDWEMILVDDGSPDRCPQICDEAARKDERIKVIHKENAGALAARYGGYKIATGEYLVFLDADDWLLSGALDVLYSSIVSDGGYDFVKSKVLRINDEGKEWIEHYPFEEGILNGKDTILDSIFCNKISPYLHSGIYRKDIFRDEYFHQVINSELSIGEDWAMNVLISQNTKRIKMIETPTFVYYWNNFSVMTTTIRSPRYPALVEKAIGSFLNDSSSEIRHRFLTMKISNYIVNCFRPEINFSKDRYKLILSYVNNPGNWQNIKKLVPLKYIWSIKSPIVFLCYSWLYRTLYYWFVLKGHYRKIYPL